jgi:hypothetical protein
MFVWSLFCLATTWHIVSGFSPVLERGFAAASSRSGRKAVLDMAMEPFFERKLESIQRTFDGLTERLADPDMAEDRKVMLTLSRERASMESTIEAYIAWRDFEAERIDLVEMEQVRKHFNFQSVDMVVISAIV